MLTHSANVVSLGTGQVFVFNLDKLGQSFKHFCYSVFVPMVP